jgi:ligand-binding sensor domain-containing protein
MIVLNSYISLTYAQPQSLSNKNISNTKTVYSIYIDDNGIKCVGHSSGLARFDGSQWTYYTDNDYLKGKEVFDIEPDVTSHGSELWLATDYGATVAAYDIDGITSATTYTAKDDLFDNNANSVAIDTGNIRYIGVEDGVSYFINGSWDSITYNSYPTSIPPGIINDLATHNNLLYVATSEGIGRFKMDIDGITGASRWTSEYGMTPLSGNIISAYIDNNGDQWFGTDAGAEKHTGLSAKENWFLYTTSEGLVNNYINVIAEDDDGTVWFGTNGGVSKFQNDTWTNYTTNNGLISDTIFDIDFDLDGSVWFATNQGVCRLYNDEFEDIPVKINNISLIDNPEILVRIKNPNRLEIIYEPVSNDKIIIKLYNLAGILIRIKKFFPVTIETNYLSMNTGGISSGIYIIQIIQGNYSITKKIIIN